MPRFLIVEDDLETSKVLCNLLQLHFKPLLPGEGEPQIDIAATVIEAKELIKNARKPYHAVILDFRLPMERPGEWAKVDETLCRQLMHSTPAPVIAHITSNPNDENVKAHLKEDHTEHANRYDFALSKDETTWVRKLLIELKKVLYGQPIEDQLDLIFGKEAETRSPGLILAPGISRGKSCLTQELADLCRHIVLRWDDLDEQLQSRIEGAFVVNKENHPIKISLL